MLIDLHCHTSGISHCCLLPAREICKIALNAGFDGICLTNHYCKQYVVDDNFDEWIEKYIDEYELTKREGQKIGLKVFFGVEITAGFDERVHLLLYGVSPQFLREEKRLYDKSLKELHEIAKKYSLVLVQAHPFRNSAPLMNTEYLDGVEINCHPMYPDTFSEKLEKIAKENGLVLTCGCDYHGDTKYRAKGGTYFPDDVKNEKTLADFLSRAKEIKLRIQEINSPTFYEKNFILNRNAKTQVEK